MTPDLSPWWADDFRSYPDDTQDPGPSWPIEPDAAELAAMDKERR